MNPDHETLTMEDKTMGETNRAETKANPNGTTTQQAAMNGWKKVVEDTMVRMPTVFEELAKLEQRGFEQARVAIAESARLANASLDFAMQLSAEWRKMTLDAARRTAELATPSA